MEKIIFLNRVNVKCQINLSTGNVNMNRRAFIKTSGVIAAQASVFASSDVDHSPQQQSQPQMAPPVNPFEQEGKWYKAALHAHTTTSDGDVDVPTRIGQYRKLGYDIAAITDHWATNDVGGFSDDKFLAICGMEAHPQTGTKAPRHHLVCLDLPHPFELDRDLPAQDLVDRILSVGGVVFYAHPYWTAHTLEEMSKISGYVAVEVFNGICELQWGKGFGNVHWDQVLNNGFMIAGMATDDVHYSHQINIGWTMIKAKSLARSVIMEAIIKGAYYASSGPTIEDWRIDNGTIHLNSSPASQINFYFNGAAGGHVTRPKEGHTITTAKWKIDNSYIKWIRAEVIGRDGKSAWTNPILTGL